MTSDRDVAAAMAARAARRHHQLRRLQRRGRRGGSSGRRAEPQRVRGPGPGQGRRGSRRHPRSLQHRLRLRRQGVQPVRRRRPSQSAQRLRRVEAAGRMVCRGRAEGVRVAGREPLWPAPVALDRRKAASPASWHAHRRRRAARLRGSNRVADLHHRRGGGDAAAHRDARRPSGCTTASSSGHCTWLEFAQELARQLGIDGPVRAGAHGGRESLRRAPEFCALSNDKLRAAGWRCRPGRTPCAGISRPATDSAMPARQFRQAGLGLCAGLRSARSRSRPVRAYEPSACLRSRRLAPNALQAKRRQSGRLDPRRVDQRRDSGGPA